MKEIKKIKILVLDDSQARLDTFKENIEQKLKVLNSTDYATTADEAIAFLKKNLDYDYIFLDRDLGDNVPSGEDVVSYIINNNYPKENVGIIVHSWNIPAGKKMCSELEAAGYHCIYLPGAWLILG